MKIEVLGPGCARCETLHKNAREALSAAGIEATIEKVSSIDRMVAYGILSTPALVINGKVICSGRVPGAAEIRGWIEAEA